MNEFLTTATLIGIAHSGVRLATPYLFAATGEMFGQRSGVLNLGVEGVMLMGAFAAYYAVFLGGDPWLGVLAALAVGALMGLLMALISVTMQAEQGISPDTLALLGDMGHTVKAGGRTIGRTQSIMLRDGWLLGATDPRRPGGWVAAY